VGGCALTSCYGGVKAHTTLGYGLGNTQADFGLCFCVQEFSRRLALTPFDATGLYDGLRAQCSRARLLIPTFS
jgi:hypothetical protein